jgi:Transposase DDE domain group 1
MLADDENLIGLMAVNRELVAQAEGCDEAERVVLDMDSTDSPVHGQQEGSAYNGHFESVCYHPLLLFNQHGDLSGGDAASRQRVRRRGLGRTVAARDRAATGRREASNVPGRRCLRQARDLRSPRRARRGIRDPYPGQQEPGVEDRKHLVSSAGETQAQTVGALQEFSLSGGELVKASAGRRQGRASPRRVVPARRLRGDEHESAEPLAGDENPGQKEPERSIPSIQNI